MPLDHPTAALPISLDPPPVPVISGRASTQTCPSPSSEEAAEQLAGATGNLTPAVESKSTRPRNDVATGERVDVWDVPFDRLDMRESVDHIDRLIQRGEPSYVVTANLNYCMLHHQSEAVRQITAGAALILADGQPIVWRSRLGNRPLPTRVAGSEMIDHLCRRAAEKGWRVYFLGGQEGVAHAAAEELRRRHPKLHVAGTESPPYRSLSPEEQIEQAARIRDARTDLLLVAFGQPKGELWIHKHYRTLGVPVSIQLGASFDFLAGTAKRAPEVYQRFGMEWAYRMFSDPKRLIPRYAGNAAFLAAALWRDWKRQVTAWGLGEWDRGGQDSSGAV